MTTQITVKFSTVDFIGTDTDNITGYDTDKSVERYAEQLQADILAEYPDAEVEVEWTSENMTRTIMYVEPDDTYEQYVTSNDVKESIQRISEDLYGDFDRWMVAGFNAEAWTTKVARDANKADIGDILVVTVAEAGPQETQDAIVEIVVLEGGMDEDSVVAYRYSTHSQDCNWRMGTVEDAVEYAEDCYQALAENDADADE